MADPGSTPDRRAARKPIILKNRLKEWCFSILLFILFFLILWEYHRWRSKPYSPFTANKATAISSALLFCLALSLGPVYRLTGWFSGALRLRRCLGLTGAIFMVIHVILSLFMVENFDWAFYWGHWLVWVFGAVTLTGFLFLWTTSYPWALEHIGRDDWKRIHRAGYLFLAMIVLHIAALGKPVNWLGWLENHDQPVPPGTTIPTAFIMATLLIRLADWYADRRRSSSG
jgi:DMSO/TMAO reductase YedYZ heme-binding membrane subunit